MSSMIKCCGFRRSEVSNSFRPLPSSTRRREHQAAFGYKAEIAVATHSASTFCSASIETVQYHSNSGEETWTVLDIGVFGTHAQRMLSPEAGLGLPKLSIRCGLSRRPSWRGEPPAPRSPSVIVGGSVSADVLPTPRQLLTWRALQCLRRTSTLCTHRRHSEARSTDSTNRSLRALRRRLSERERPLPVVRPRAGRAYDLGTGRVGAWAASDRGGPSLALRTEDQDSPSWRRRRGCRPAADLGKKSQIDRQRRSGSGRCLGLLLRDGRDLLLRHVGLLSCKNTRFARVGIAPTRDSGRNCQVLQLAPVAIYRLGIIGLVPIVKLSRLPDVC